MEHNKEVPLALGFFSTVTAVKIDKAVTTKDKLLADIDLQQQAVKAKIQGEPFNPKNSDRAFSEWFFQRGATWWTYLRAGHTPILIGGGDAFEAGATLEDVSAWYDQAAKAIRAGELDAEIEDARRRRSESLKVGKDGTPKVRAPRKKKGAA
jgi:hypothetical protein